MTLPFKRFRKWLASAIRSQERVMVLEFVGGGPKDGDRKQIGVEVTEWVVTVASPVVLSPWGLEEQPTDLYRVTRVGVYQRTATGMTWCPE